MQVRKLTKREQRMADDLAWAGHAAEVQENPEHHGKFVVVHNKRILAVGTNRQTLVQEAARQAGIAWQDLVVLIVPRPGLWEIPH